MCPEGTPWILQDSDSSHIFCQIINQGTWPVTAINSALILKTSIPVSVFPGSCCFGYVQWKKPHLILYAISQIKTLFSPSGVSFCLQGSDHEGTYSRRCSGNQIFTPGTGFFVLLQGSTGNGNCCLLPTAQEHQPRVCGWSMDLGTQP